MAKLDWEKANRREKAKGPRVGPPPLTHRPRGISNDQARELARLQREAGLPYTGRGMTAKQARKAIKRLARKRSGGTL